MSMPDIEPLFDLELEQVWDTEAKCGLDDMSAVARARIACGCTELLCAAHESKVRALIANIAAGREHGECPKHGVATLNADDFTIHHI